ncbi:Uncharacterised protein [Mycobacteroides abscessus subsp. abscessus]|nr:Uncharacterised protein [Mycobacteroides abscessus subsp. abscessus]
MVATVEVIDSIGSIPPPTNTVYRPLRPSTTTAATRVSSSAVAGRPTCGLRKSLPRSKISGCLGPESERRTIWPLALTTCTTTIR